MIYHALHLTINPVTYVCVDMYYIFVYLYKHGHRHTYKHYLNFNVSNLKNSMHQLTILLYVIEA